MAFQFNLGQVVSCDIINRLASVECIYMLLWGIMLEYSTLEGNTTYTTSDYTRTNFSIFTQENANATWETEINGNKSWEALAIMCIIAVVAMGNILAILAVSIDRKLQSSTNYFLMSLAVADLLVALTVMPPSLAMIVNNYSWPFPDIWCGIWAMLDVCFSTSSILHLCMISLDRYMALANPLGNSAGKKKSSLAFIINKSIKLKGETCGILQKLNCCRREGNYTSPMLAGGSTKGVKKRIVLVWTTSLGIALPLPVLQSKNRANVFVGDMCAINIADFQIYASFVAFFLPLVIMMIVYSLTIRSLQKQAKFISQIMGNNSTRKHTGQTTPSISTNNNFNRCSVKSRPRNVDDVSVSSFSMNHNREVKAKLIDNSNSCWKVFSGHFVSREESDWASNDSEDMDYSMYRNKSIKRGLHKSDSDSSKGSDCPKSPLVSRANLTIGKAFNKVYRGKSTVTRKLSTSLKAKAIANISTEQRASKVLGLIFVLFCVFWCPFFITNVTSRLCHTCDQDRIGQLMNWFVWAGYVSSGVNPLVYTLFSRRFRTTFHYLLTCNYSKINRSNKFAWRTSEENQNSSFRRSHSRLVAPPNVDTSSVSKLALSTESEFAPARITRNSYHSRSVMVRPSQPTQSIQSIRGTHSESFTRKHMDDGGSLPKHSSVTNVKKHWRTSWPSPAKENRHDETISGITLRVNSESMTKMYDKSNNPQSNNTNSVDTNSEDNLPKTGQPARGREQEGDRACHFNDQLFEIKVEFCDDNSTQYQTKFNVDIKNKNIIPLCRQCETTSNNNNNEEVINIGNANCPVNSNFITPSINIDESALGTKRCLKCEVRGLQTYT